MGCGNPTAIASLKKGEVVLDLGSCAGLDCFLASKEVGEKGEVIISNCVINLSLDKQRVFYEAFRVLKTGGRLAISDIVLTKKIPSQMITLDSYGACISGASFIDDLETVLKKLRF